MTLSSSFRERLEHMEKTRMEGFSLLQKCLKLNQKIVSQQYIISSLKSKLDRLDSKYLNSLQQFRVLKDEVGELTELEKEKSLYLALKARDIDEFRVQAQSFAVECRIRVDELRDCLKELSSSFFELQRNTGYQENSDLAAAEARKYELLAAKENLASNLTSNYQTRAQFQKQLLSILIAQNEEGRKSSQIA